MSVVDKIVAEWAFRCKKGYPDMNNPDDMKILKEIYSEYGVVSEKKTEIVDYDTAISTALQTISDQEKKKAILQYLQRVASNEDEEDAKDESSIEQILQSKKLGKEFVEYVTLLAHKFGVTKQFNSYLQKTTVTYAKLKAQDNLVKLFTSTKLPEKFITKLIGIQGRGVGKGEVALIAFIKDCENTGGKKGEAKGDVKIGTQDIEIKVANAQLVPYDLAGYGSKPVGELQSIIGKDLELNRGRWTDTVQQYFMNSENKEEVLIKINKVIKAFYSNQIPAITQDILETGSLTRYVADNLAKLYIGEGKHIMLIDETSAAYTFIENYQDYLESINSGKIVISAFSDKLPRLEYRNR